jgi:acetylornithine/N-succinyldiaminopimelate aminotransferase
MEGLSLRNLFLSHLAPTSKAPLMFEVERAEGVYMYSPGGGKILDLISGISVSNIGHCHPAVVQAVQKQAASYMHLMVYGEAVQAPQVLLAKALADMLPADIDSVYFVNSGSEATEAAIKLAKRATGRPEIVSFRNAYHGSTSGALSLMGCEYFKQRYRPLLPGINIINFGCADELASITERTAAVFAEPVQGEAGIVMPPAGYMQALRKRCDETGTLLVLDEIQTGFGRTGRMFGFETCGIVPDIVLFAKGLGGGMPIGALAASKKLMCCFAENPILGHITTFGGHPVSCAAALAGLNFLRSQPQLISDAQRKGQLFAHKLQSHKMVKKIWGLGLFMAVELGSSEIRETVVTAALSNGLLTDPFLFRDDCIRICPPLIINDEQISEACDILLRVFDLAAAKYH